MEMKGNFQTITSFVIALAVMLTAVVFDVPGTVVAKAAQLSSAGGCDGTHAGM